MGKRRGLKAHRGHDKEAEKYSKKQLHEKQITGPLSGECVWIFFWRILYSYRYIVQCQDSLYALQSNCTNFIQSTFDLSKPCNMKFLNG